MVARLNGCATIIDRKHGVSSEIIIIYSPQKGLTNARKSAIICEHSMRSGKYTHKINNLEKNEKSS